MKIQFIEIIIILNYKNMIIKYNFYCYNYYNNNNNNYSFNVYRYRNRLG